MEGKTTVYTLVRKILLLVIFIIACLYFILPKLSSGPHDQSKTQRSSQVRQVAMAIIQYEDNYGHLPQNWENLNGQNQRGKVYYTGDRVNIEGNKIHIIYDIDGDNTIEFQGQTIEGCVAVWSLYKGEMITSWEK